MATYIKCTYCETTENISDGTSLLFQKDKSKKFGFRKQCKKCRSILRKEWTDKNRNKINRINASRKMKERYGITVEDYDIMLEKQNGKCDICGTTKPTGKRSRFSIDHCHSTGKIRGLLCNNCNSGIGKLQDNKDIVMKAFEYLVKNGGAN